MWPFIQCHQVKTRLESGGAANSFSNRLASRPAGCAAALSGWVEHAISVARTPVA
jgi:hypothetical protein